MLTIPIDVCSPLPLYEQIYRSIKQDIQSGRLKYQEKLPSVRSLSRHLGISRNTVDMAYAQLTSEGYAEARPKSGHYVCRLSSVIRKASAAAPVSTDVVRMPEREYKYDFSPYDIDLSNFPYQTWCRLYRNCLYENKQLFLLGPSQGDAALRNAVCRYLWESRGVNCSSEQMIIGAGADYLLQLLSALLPRHTKIAMENPAYIQACKIFKGLGLEVCPVGLDQYGLKTAELAGTTADLAYVTPSHQYPFGIVMPVQRRMELLQWAGEKENRYIIEDDHDSEFRYRGRPIPSLQSIDCGNNVIYIGTFSRAIAPAIRIGYMVLPPTLLSVYRRDFYYLSSTVPRIDQAILTDYIENGHFERHLNRMRMRYKQKHDHMVKALKELGPNVTVTGEHAGLHVILSVKTGKSEAEILRLAASCGIKLYGLSELYIQAPPEPVPTFLMGFANLAESSIHDGIKALPDIFWP